MTKEQQSAEAVDRRKFLKAAILTAAAATAGGAGAAVLQNQSRTAATQTAVSLPTAPVAPAAQTVVNLNPDTADLMARLATAQAENVRLQAALDAAQRNLDSLQGSGSNQGELELVRAELGQANERLSLLSGLVALYEQLDGVDIGDAWENGVAAFSTRVDELVAEVPTLSEGIELGRAALDELDDHIPLLENGRFWLHQLIF